jgi:hypothetical protein
MILKVNIVLGQLTVLMLEEFFIEKASLIVQMFVER